MIYTVFYRKYGSGTYFMGITGTSKWTRWRLKSPASQLFNQKFIKAQIKENIKAPRHWPLWGEFPAQRTSNAENVSIWWRHHGLSTPDIGRYPWPWPTTDIFPTSNPNPNRISWHTSDIDHTSRWALGLISGGDTEATLLYFIVMNVSAFGWLF